MPDHAVLPNATDSALLVLVAFCSFTSHAFIARAFQVENAAKSAAAGYLQVTFEHALAALLKDTANCDTSLEDGSHQKATFVMGDVLNLGSTRCQLEISMSLATFRHQ